MNILVTGAGGFVGKQIVNQLETKKVNLKLVLRKNSDMLITFSGKHDIVETDDMFAENKDWWIKVLDDVDLVIRGN